MPIIVITKRALIIAAAIVAILIAGVIIAISMADSSATNTSAAVIEQYEAEVLAGKKKELPVYSVEREDKAIALTIDAAWEDDKTPFILDTLDKYKIKATFFLCGFWVDEYPDMVKEIAARGHEIGNHTATHPHMTKLSPADMKKDIEKCESAIEKLTGKRSALFRAPYGEYNDSVILTVREMGYEVLQWDVDTVDWREERSADTILNTVRTKLHPGAVILSHNNGFKIESYLPTLIEEALSGGYTFVTGSELLLTGETLIDANGVMKNK